MIKHRLLLIDLDDTLLSSTWFYDGLKKTIKIHPLTEKLDEVIFFEKMRNVPKYLLEKLTRKELTPLEFRRERWRQSFAYFDVVYDIELLDEIDGLFLKISMDYIIENKKLIDLLNDLQAHYQLGIVTNGLYDPRIKIKKMQLSVVFPDDCIFDAEQLGYRKPDQEIYLAALNHFGKEPRETLFIGDSWTHDIVGPMEVGMDAIWVNKKGIKKRTPHHPFAIVSDILEVRSILLRN
ncbi:HAD family hydrolase [Bacillus sp. FJAT-49711]|uniref:HAD family hydrolase n=1 Tax=Bacillus sp. FJAT-49711 TaxID=2833585 RepID=UPI001BC9BA86|nr:HAD family hydrolase [Bacillus sp. FJAT-49711]MBS4218822.1 HAD family hydrolase [Bacillus sp. FJAT-49711]